MAKEETKKEVIKKRRKIDIACPGCGELLVTDALCHDHAWCINKDCRYFIHVKPGLDLMFSSAGNIDFWNYVIKEKGEGLK